MRNILDEGFPGNFQSQASLLNEMPNHSTDRADLEAKNKEVRALVLMGPP
jgi:hypothetical protein